VPISIVVSALLFAFAHFSVEFWRLVTLGVFLGTTFVLTRNLAAPTLMHALWNMYVYYHIMSTP
jgi:membrane protease YdiL (CAAX protease family)